MRFGIPSTKYSETKPHRFRYKYSAKALTPAYENQLLHLESEWTECGRMHRILVPPLALCNAARQSFGENSSLRLVLLRESRIIPLGTAWSFVPPTQETRRNEHPSPGTYSARMLAAAQRGIAASRELFFLESGTGYYRSCFLGLRQKRDVLYALCVEGTWNNWGKWRYLKHKGYIRNFVPDRKMLSTIWNSIAEACVV